jgi:hypothetical protein
LRPAALSGQRSEADHRFLSAHQLAGPLWGGTGSKTMTANRDDDLHNEGPAAMMSRAILRLGCVVVVLIVLALTGCADLPSPLAAHGRGPVSIMR